VTPHDLTTPHRRIRVALVGCTGLLGDIIGRTVAEHPEIEVVGDFSSGELPAPDAADLVVWNGADEGTVASWLLAVRREPRVLATVGDGRRAALWELTPHRTLLGALSPTTLAEAIAAEPGGGGP
jgi:hypothetical protein